ncbi:BZ3500_MvSof-1268-A1-R1_Chr6-3g08695 [Microbotryum saponariae]|uniref:BZ3500_MvSof-1268-A1-R1_Chr6-3g08695 protein n=1 Tax=Microbotryum saponariae TaxID=289078 RepID=A0A2X0MH24_9BASI|nr:BZ3500_MvSof-1268-A1-R1_Chr6-3g08695 [Microbotryum saponariae]SDA07296.1 BZ3501_MvSof-1269-A2-R1_Chr6-2g08398 [Microbotryum saponariae]
MRITACGLVVAVARLVVAGSTSTSDLRVALSSSDSSPPSLVARYIECLGIEDPSAYYPFISWLTANRPETASLQDAKSNPEVEPPKLPPRSSEPNFLFTRQLSPLESWRTLESNRFRGRFLNERGEKELFYMAIANGQADGLLEEMYKAWEKREKLVPVAEGGERCESWIDVQGHRACSVKQFWELVGAEQSKGDKPLKIRVAGDKLAAEPFDRLEPPMPDDSLPFFVLYGSTDDETFAKLFDELNRLAGGDIDEAEDAVRLQFTIRWKPDSRTSKAGDAALSAFGVKLSLKDVTALDAEHRTDLRRRAINTVVVPDSLEPLASFVAQSPLVGPSLSGTSDAAAGGSFSDDVYEESITINGLSLDIDHADPVDLIHFLRRERGFIADIASLHPSLTFAHAREILIGSSVSPAEEVAGRSAKNVIKPSKHHPLKVVNLVQAMHDLPSVFIEAAFLESVESDGDEVPEGQEAPPDKAATTTIYVITDLDSPQGLDIAQEALIYIDSTPEVRINFVHNPVAVDVAEHAFTFSNLLYLITESGNMREVFPAELLTWLAYEVTKDGMETPIPNIWDEENPMTPFVTLGADEADAEAAKEYWQAVQEFAARVGVEPGASAIVINGRVVALPGNKFNANQFQQIVAYEYEVRIGAVVAMVDETIPATIKEDRVAVANLYNAASSIVASSLMPPGTPIRVRASLPFSSDYLRTVVQRLPQDALWDIDAVLDPLSARSQRWVPLLQSLSQLEHTNLRLYPITANSPMASTLYGVAFPLVPVFDEKTQEPLRPSAIFSDLALDKIVSSVEIEKRGMVHIEGGERLSGKTIKEIPEGRIELRARKRAAGGRAAEQASESSRTPRDEL